MSAGRRLAVQLWVVIGLVFLSASYVRAQTQEPQLGADTIFEAAGSPALPPRSEDDVVRELETGIDGEEAEGPSSFDADLDEAENNQPSAAGQMTMSAFLVVAVPIVISMLA